MRKDDFKSSGFTLLEIMIAVAIFGFLMVYVSQLMHLEIRLFNSASKQNDVDHNTRAAMMHILDELRLNSNKYYYDGGDSTQISRVYYKPTQTSKVCIICVDPNYQLVPDPLLSGKPSLADGTSIIMYLDNNNPRNLWYRDINNPSNPDQLIADKIQSISIKSSGRLLEIEVIAKDVSINYTYKLISYIRLY